MRGVTGGVSMGGTRVGRSVSALISLRRGLNSLQLLKTSSAQDAYKSFSSSSFFLIEPREEAEEELARSFLSSGCVNSGGGPKELRIR